MGFSILKFQPQWSHTVPFSSFFQLEPALPHTHAHVPNWTPEVLLLTGFNFLNSTPTTRSIAGTYGFLLFQCATRTDLNSTIFVIFSVRPCTAPHTRTCTSSDHGGLVAHGFQLFERYTPYPINSRCLYLSSVSNFNPNGPKLHHFCPFFG